MRYSWQLLLVGRNRASWASQCSKAVRCARALQSLLVLTLRWLRRYGKELLIDGALHIYATTFVQWPNWQPLDYYEVYLAAENFNTSKMLLNYVSSHFKWSQYCWKTQINVTKMKSVLLEHAKSSVYSHNMP